MSRICECGSSLNYFSFFDDPHINCNYYYFINLDMTLRSVDYKISVYEIIYIDFTINEFIKIDYDRFTESWANIKKINVSEEFIPNNSLENLPNIIELLKSLKENIIFI